MGCSKEQSLENLKKARGKHKLPPGWRSPEEARVVRMFVWQWLLGRGPECGKFALARWLGVQHWHIRHLKKKLPLDEAEFDREVARSGAPTVEALRAAREKSRSMRARGLLRTQPRFKEIKEPGTGRIKAVPTKPNAVTLVLDGKIPLAPPGREPRKGGRPKKRPVKKRYPLAKGRENMKCGRATGIRPRPWRSPSESRLVRMLVWQWLLGRGPHVSQRTLAGWLGISRTWVRLLRKRLPLDQAEFLREVARTGVPTLEALAGARQDSRYMREMGLLRTQRPYKTVKCEWNGLAHWVTIRKKPNNVTLALDGMTPLEPPGRVGPGEAAPDEFTTRMWKLRMREEVQKKMKPVMPRRWRGGGSGMR